MLRRWLGKCGLGLLAAQPALAADCQNPPTELPPLLTPPATAAPPPSSGPRGPTGEYDHNHLYLPDYNPPRTTAPEVCRPLGRWWVNAEFELAFLPNRPVPGTLRLRAPDGFGGRVPGPYLAVNGQSASDLQGGFGLAVGRWFGESNTHGVEGSFFTLGGGDTTIDGFAPGMLVLFPDGADRSAPAVLLLPPSVPITGVFPATLTTWFVGADVNYRCNVYCSANARIDALAGYRFAFVQDELFIGESPDAGDDYKRNRAAVSNPFHGGQIGLAGEYRIESWYVSGNAKVAFGTVTTEVTASGLFLGADALNGTGGFAPLPALGQPTRSQFAVLPTLNVTLGRQIREHTRLYAGYSFQYLSCVTRLADVVTPTTGPTAPTTDFWVQAVNFGVEWRW